jgi:outer membrane receptor protein involved in Fe transport
MKGKQIMSRVVSMAVLGWALAQAPAMAQDTSADQAGADEGDVIIVTAQKREQSLQDVPIAVSAFSEATLRDKRIEDATDLSFSVPNLTVTDAGASLRGIGNLAISSTSEGGLGYHINGAYIGAPASVQNYYDVERIEVLRGPQGTLYGRNTTAGVLNIITRKPKDELGGYLTASYGNYNAIHLDGALNLPIAPNLAVRIAGFFEDHDGYATNLFNGHGVDDRHMYGLRGTIGYDNGDTKATLMVAYFNENDRRNFGTKGVCKKDPAIGCSPLERGFETPDSRVTIFRTLGAISGTLNPTVDYFAGSLNPTNLRQINQDIDPGYYDREWFGTFELSHDFGDISLTSLTSYQERRTEVTNDFDRFVPTTGLLRPITLDPLADGNRITTSQIVSGRRDSGFYKQWTQELRLASKFSGPFNFLIGGNYYDQKIRYLVNITHPTLAAMQQGFGSNAIYEAYRIQTDPATTKSYGLFGEVYFDLSDNTSLTGGIRYSHDKKTILTRQLFLDPIFNPAQYPTGNSIVPYTVGLFEKGQVTGRVVLDHKFSSKVMAYVSASRGYKAGGINPGGAVSCCFAPEYVNAGEIGLKASTSDNSLSINTSAFYYDYKGLQIGQVGVTSATTTNTDAKIYGAEIEWIARPSGRWQFDGSLSLLSTEIKNFRSGDEGDPNGAAPGAVLCTGTSATTCMPGGPGPYFSSGGVRLKVLDGNKLPFSPGIKLAVGLQYKLPLSSGWTLTSRIDHYQQSKYFGSAFNKPIDQFSGYSQTDVKLTLASDQDKIVIQGFVKNLLNNDDVIRMTQEGPLVGRFRSLIILEPRTYGVAATYKF